MRKFHHSSFLWKKIMNQQFDFKSDFFLQADFASQDADFMSCFKCASPFAIRH